MHLSRSMVATLAVVGATCALPALAASQAATRAPKAGTYVDAKAAFNLRVAKSHKTITAISGSCFSGRVQKGVWGVTKLAIVHNAFMFKGRVRVVLASSSEIPSSTRLTLTIHGTWTGTRFTGTLSSSSPRLCARRRFSAKFLAHPDA